ncbi:MAG: trypsin-like peptidase domain-containing protein, partial [Kiritimatiellaeota bacterium]|nr:trypsin-like peptidase domain-containing protein [Kiritimatiellota bacterium]
ALRRHYAGLFPVCRLDYACRVSIITVQPAAGGRTWSCRHADGEFIERLMRNIVGQPGMRGPLILILGLLSGGLASASVNRRTPVVTAVEQALPGVVNIGTERLVQVQYADPLQRFRGDLFDQFFRDFYAQHMPPQYQLSHSLGSGVIIDPLGYILTNFHVIERASRIQVKLADAQTYAAAFLAGDPLNDLALIKIEPRAPLQAIAFARDDDTLLGETVIALGNPFGLEQTVTVGVLSAKNREARYDGKVLYTDILQTDAAVNPGSSGGPLLNLDAELIGINVAIYQAAQSIGFALPVKRARELVGRWLSPRLLKKQWLGFEVEPQAGALRVVQVAQDLTPRGEAPAEGDVVLALNRQPVATLFDYHRALLPLATGQVVRLTLRRGTETRELAARMRPLPRPDGAKLALELLGLTLQPLGEVSRTPALQGRPGLAITAAAENRAAYKAGVRPGLLLARINNVDVTTLDDVGVVLENIRRGAPVNLVVVSLREQSGMLISQSAAVTLPAGD